LAREIVKTVKKPPCSHRVGVGFGVVDTRFAADALDERGVPVGLRGALRLVGAGGRAGRAVVRYSGEPGGSTRVGARRRPPGPLEAETPASAADPRKEKGADRLFNS
jgi:hypothetical protein